MKINFDKRIELIFGLQYSVFTEYNIEYMLLSTNNKKYCNDFYELYKMFCSDKLKEYIKNGGLDTYNRTLEIALSLDENYNLSNNEYIELIEEKNKNFDSKRLSDLLKEFVSVSNYEQFYSNKREYYDYAIDEFKKSINKYSSFDEKIITDFFGYKIGEFEVKIFNFSMGSFGCQFNDKIVYVANMKQTNEENKIAFYDMQISSLFHEFSHPYCNPLGYKYFKNKDMSNFYKESVQNGLESCYNDFIIVINEYMVRAIQTYLCSKFISPEKTIGSIKNHKKLGYIHIEELINLFDKKNEYESFEEFYKMLIVPFFEKLNVKKTLI